MSELEELRTEANELGVQYAKTTGAKQLKEKIEAFYENSEKSAPSVQEKVKEVEEKESKKDSVEKAKALSKAEKIKAREAAAKKTRVVTIIDNDQRVNNNTTTCTASCGNEFFDLGTKIIPLNEKVEVRMGHINTLKEVRIPQHIKDKSGMSSVRMRPRYSISYED